MTREQAAVLIFLMSLLISIIAFTVATQGQHIEAQLKRIAVAVEKGTVQ